MYYFVAFSGLLLLVLGYYRSRSFMHPAFVWALILYITFYLDFTLRGYSDKEILDIPRSSLYSYQLSTVIFTFVSWSLIYFFGSKPLKIAPETQRQLSVHVGLILFASLILGLEVYRRLSFSDWDASSTLSYSFGSRGDRPWMQADQFGDETFAWQLVGILLPLATLLFGLAALFGRTFQPLWIMSSMFWGIGCLILFGNGSRTFFAVGFFVPIAIWFYMRGSSRRGRFRRAITLVTSLCSLPVFFSHLYLYRNVGVSAAPISITDTMYHMDNSYYLAMKAAHISSTTAERWVASDFLLVSVANFIPRAIWAGKPVLDHEFWGSYKLFYITSTYLGEAHAMFGPFWAYVFALGVGLLIVRLLFFVYRRAGPGVRALPYILITYYCYMICRSLLNTTMAIYVPAAAVICLIAIGQIRNRRRRTGSRQRQIGSKAIG